MNAFVVVDIVKHCAGIGHHKHVGSKDGSRSGRRLVNGEEGMNGRELAADFLFLNVEESSDVLDHLFVGEGHFVAGRAVWRRRGDDVGGVASAIGGRG